jgi:TIR domain-containing protein
VGEAINDELDASEVILLLVSPHFVASNFIHKVELERAMARHEAGKALVIPVLLRDVAWEGLRFATLQALPRDRVPVVQWEDRDKAFAAVTRELENALAAWSARPGRKS